MELIVGAEDCRTYLAFSWPDWEADVAAVLHERRGGWADPMQTVRHLADRARAAGAVIQEGVEVTGFELQRGCCEGGAFHCRSGSAMRPSNRRFCSSLPTSSQILIRCTPPSTMCFSNSGVSLRKRSY